jgi:23S rRNA (cytidine1920-2'-O)/16S rRNA (cytidine1409-2'-O)-methyltransferase
MVDAGEPVVIQGSPPRFVSRGGEKLDAALDVFGLEVDRPSGRSTPGPPPAGSPTACCSGAPAQVVAVDVGHGQLHERLRRRRVAVLERTNVRHLRIPRPLGPDAVVADLSFISLRTVMPAPRPCWRSRRLTWSCWSSPSSRPAGRR